jgi:hypothetical protein
MIGRTDFFGLYALTHASTRARAGACRSSLASSSFLSMSKHPGDAGGHENFFGLRFFMTHRENSGCTRGMG